MVNQDRLEILVPQVPQDHRALAVFQVLTVSLVSKAQQDLQDQQGLMVNQVPMEMLDPQANLEQMVSQAVLVLME